MSSKPAASTPAEQSILAPDMASDSERCASATAVRSSNVPAINISATEHGQPAHAAPEVPAKENAGMSGADTSAAVADSAAGNPDRIETKPETASPSDTTNQRTTDKKKGTIKRASRFVGVAAAKVVEFVTKGRKHARATAPVGQTSSGSESTALAEKDTIQPPAVDKEPTRKTSPETIPETANAAGSKAMVGSKAGTMDDTATPPTDVQTIVPTATDQGGATTSPEIGPGNWLP
ncbi:hypothetical protein HDU86_000384 [Geranomyces michiganensis]|nr:hypothetical protein HDU86_000384 [Geranomyces michiganensis]